MTPWHLVPSDFRAYVLRVLDDMRHPAFASAAALLREAAPYPDEAYVVQHVFTHAVYEVADPGFVGPVPLVAIASPFARCYDDGSIGYLRPEILVGLTPAARDLLDALRGGS